MTTKTATVTPIASAAAKARAKDKSVKAHGAMSHNHVHADEAHKDDRAKLLRAIDTAEAGLGEALINALRMTVRYGKTSTEEVAEFYTRCNNPAVYSSWFNLGAKAQAVVGEKLALDAIERAIATGKGAAFQRAREALSMIVRKASQAGVKTVDGRKASTLVKEAVGLATAAAVVRKDKKSAAKGAQGPRTATMGAAAIESGKGAKEVAVAVKLVSQNASRLPAPEGREAAWGEALAALQLAAEKFAVFAK